MIAINIINDIRKLCFEGALLPALFISDIFENNTQNKKIYFSVGYELPTLRVGAQKKG